MDPFALTALGVIASIGATVRWLRRAPEGHEDDNGFHAYVDGAAAARRESIHSDSTPPFVPHRL